MRELIRPSLFIVARLGLFLTVVVWIVSQWRSGEIHAATVGHGVMVQFDTKAWFATLTNPPCRVFQFEINSAKEIRNDGFEVEMTLPGAAPSQGLITTTQWWQVAGLGYAKTLWAFRVSIRHWLVVTIFALFYGVLKWVYGKRGKELAADE